MGKDKLPNQTNNFVDNRAEIGSVFTFDIVLRWVAITKVRKRVVKTNFRIKRSEQSGIKATGDGTTDQNNKSASEWQSRSRPVCRIDRLFLFV